MTILLAMERARALDSETFDDYRRVGKGAEARKNPDPLVFDNHYFLPVLEYKVLDFLTPHFYAAETAGYTDNMLDDHDGNRPIHTPYSRTTVGGRGDVQVEDHVFSLGSHATESLFTRAPDANDDVFETGTEARADLNFNDVAVHGDASWERSAFPTAIQLRGLAREDAYSTQGWVEGAWNRLGLKVGGSFRRDFFIEPTSQDQALDHKTYGASAQANLRIYEKLKALLEYNFEAVRFDERVNRDYDAHQIRGGLDGELTPKITLSIKVGLAYQVPYLNTGDFPDTGRYLGVTAACAVAWQALPTLTLTAAYRRDLTYAVGANFETVDYVDVSGRYNFGPAEKLFFAGGFTWEHGIVDNGDHVDRIHARAQLGYAIQKWLEVSAGYTYVQVLASGTLKSSTFDEHRGEVSLAIGF